MNKWSLLNGLALAYIGDAAYELRIREYLLTTGKIKPNQLHRLATQFVSAKAQSHLIAALVAAEQLNEEEIGFFKRGRNAKSHTSAKNADIQTYRMSTGFEALMGYLYMSEQSDRLEELTHWCIQRIEEDFNVS
ncbi:Mini-ribonuclease 3 [Lacticigenium naphthae]|uniref:Mini-ribonuclease 3 n=1 Tax=Lacticigenium naphthae TaxID=515351 RepID=UPI003CCBF171